MNILLLGANGGIGKHVLEQALANGDKVIAYVRKENAITIKHEHLIVKVGTLTNESLLLSLLSQVDVVISALGPHMDMKRKVTALPISDFHELIIKLMKTIDKRRFITMGTTTVKAKTDIKHYSNTILPWIPRILFPTGFREYRRIGEIMESSDLDWTVVRFLDLNGKHKNNTYQVTLDGKSSNLKISRENIAHFTYKVASEKLYIKEMPLIFH